MTTLWFDLEGDEMDEELDEELDNNLVTEEAVEEDYIDRLEDLDEETEVYCKQCGALVEDGFQCEICGWMVEVV